uniref:DUF155 domain-containing protein n=1 Tax=Macrostomum lignano TaxID=282301 RepID=A0A1I8F234_9PLAT
AAHRRELLSNSDYFLNINHTAPGFVRIRRLRSVRSPSLSDGSDGEEFSSLSHSRREQAQADGRGQTDSRYATFPRRSKPDGAGDASNAARRSPPPAMTASSWCTCRAAAIWRAASRSTIAEEAEAEAEAEAAAADDAFTGIRIGVAEETIVSTAAAVLPNNHDGEADEAFSELDKVLDQVDGQAQAGGDKTDRLADKTAVQRPPSRSRVGFSLLAVLGAVVLFELGEPPEPLRWLRSHPVAHDVHERFYAPARARLMEIGASAVARLR